MTLQIIGQEGKQTRLYHTGIARQIALPDTKYPVATRLQIGILRSVKRDPSPLSRIRAREFVWVAMPVIPVELHHHPPIRNKSVDTKLVGNNRLRDIRNTNAIQHCIPRNLQLIRGLPLLIGSHLPQSRLKLGIGIAALLRAIQDATELLKRRRLAKRLTADLAFVGDLGASLPFIRMCARTKIVCQTKTLFRDVDRCVTDRAGAHLASLPRRLGGLSITRQRTVTGIWSHRTSDGLATSDANDCACFVVRSCTHGSKYTTNAITQRPLVLMRAAKDLGRSCLGVELSEAYCRVAVDRLRQAVLPLATA